MRKVTRYIVERGYYCPALGWEEDYLQINHYGDVTWTCIMAEAERFETKSDAEYFADTTNGSLKILEVQVIKHDDELAVPVDIDQLMVASDFLEERGFSDAARQLKIRAKQLL